METPPAVNVEQATAALAAVRHSRARVAWSGYPLWYWLATGAGLGVGTALVLLPYWWSALVAAVDAVAVAGVARAAGRARGICEGWIRSAMTWREGLALYGPATMVILAGTVASRLTAVSPWSALGAAVLVFVLFVVAGRTLSARAARR